jgi:signal transduction histidine kinase
MMEIQVTDTGVGMNETDMSKIFRIDVSYTTKGTAMESGTGLGLILCKELVARNGGQIWAESKPGVGTTFYFTLPLG